MNEVYLIAGMAVVTYLIRYPLFAVAEQIAFPDFLSRALQYVPPAVLAAIIFPSTLMPEGTLQLNYSNPWLLGGLVAALVAWRSRNLLVTIVAGMIAFGVCKWFLEA